MSIFHRSLCTASSCPTGFTQNTEEGEEINGKILQQGVQSNSFSRSSLARIRKIFWIFFNALNGTSYGNAEEIEYTTLESDRGFFLRLKNDLSFIIDRTLGVYEHQSTTTSANIALRLLHYYSDLMRKMIDGKLLYRARMVKIPAPQFIVFYNGRNEQADEVIFHLPTF